MKLWVFLVPVAASVGGCAHTLARPPLVTALDAFLYAQLAQNAYRKPSNEFVLDTAVKHVGSYPDQTVNVREYTGHEANDIFGLGFEIYEHTREPGKVDTIFAFRGTEGDVDLGSCDFRFGNFRVMQQRLATELVARYVTSNNIDRARLVLVGHSLGGGIARHVSMRLPGGMVYAFDSSPRFKAPYGYDPRSDKTQRFSINAAGEVLKLARLFGIEPNQTYWKVDCGIRGNAIARHSMRGLAACLTDKAAKQTHSARFAFPGAHEMARKSLRENGWAFSYPPVPDPGTPRYLCPR